MNLRVAFRMWWVSCLLAAMGCSSGAVHGDSEPVQDAGNDAGQDIGQDAWHDTGQDAGQDTGQDTGQDAWQESGYEALPDAAHYPRIFNLWGSWNDTLGAAFYAGFNAYAMYSDGSSDRDKSRADAIHAQNPNTLVLLTADVVPAHDVGRGLDTQPQWWSAVPGTPDYACIYRDSSGNILRDVTYTAAYNNLGNAYCRDVLVNYFVNKWNSTGNHFDGWQMDQMGSGGVSWALGADIDADVDGVPDDLAQVDADHTAGMTDILARLRAALPQILILANDSPPWYGQWINGRYFEMDLRRYLDKTFYEPWPVMLETFKAWSQQNKHLPNLTNVSNTGDAVLIAAKYNFENIWTAIKPPMMAEYASDFNRMRFGLATALMADAMYSYDLGSYMYGLNWWYDEYGIKGQPGTTGYLGQPTGPTVLAIDHLDTPDEVLNGDFNAGADPWFIGKSGADISATYVVEPTDGYNNSPGAHIHIGANPTGGGVWVTFNQDNISIVTDTYYTISFWAKADTNRKMAVRIQRQVNPWDYLSEVANFNAASGWKHFNLILKGMITASNEGRLLFDIGTATGEVYFDEVKFQAGTIGVWSREFENGLVVLNETPVKQAVQLPREYKKLSGTQAPLYFVRIDNDRAQANGPWETVDATFDQWGLTVHRISAPASATITYTTLIPYAGEYEVLAWVAPDPANSKDVGVTIQHASGEASVGLDETIGQVGWHSLGTYSFVENQTAKVALSASGTGLTIADAVKIVSIARFNDGSSVTSVVLEPDDAIVLVSP